MRDAISAARIPRRPSVAELETVMLTANPDDRQLGRAIVAIWFAGKQFRLRRFLKRKSWPADTASERIRLTAIERENNRAYLRLKSVWQLARAVSDAGDSVSLTIFLVKLYLWLEIAAELYKGELGDTHKLADAIRTTAAWRELPPFVDLTLFEDYTKVLETADGYDAISLGRFFNPTHLANYRGEPRANARGWIIRQLDAMIPQSLTIEDNRYAVFADLLGFVGIPADPVVVKDALRKRR